MRVIGLIQYKINKETHEFDPPAYLEACYLFGSYISGPFDKKSDVDHLIVVADHYKAYKEDVRTYLSKKLEIPPIWLDIYTKSEFRNNCLEGNYYFWAMKIYRKKIYAKSDFCERYFNQMPVYKTIKKTLQEERDFTDQLYVSYKRGDISKETLFKTLRHCIRGLCINILYLHGQVNFSRYGSVEKCSRLGSIILPFTYKDYEALYHEDLTITPQMVNNWRSRYHQLYKLTLYLEERMMTSSFVSPLAKYI